jgi:hypothetical protein
VPERIDYILAAGLKPMHAEVTLGLSPAGCSYSDHNAVRVSHEDLRVLVRVADPHHAQLLAESVSAQLAAS